MRMQEAVESLFVFSNMHVPDHLYRYRECGKPHSFSDVENSLITLSSPSKFNDEDDTAIHDDGTMDRMAATIIEQVDFAFEMLCNHMSVFEPAMGDQASSLLSFAEGVRNMPRPKRKEAIEGLTRQIRNQVDIHKSSEILQDQQKITCLCENSNSNYMWEQYGGAGTGYTIEYESRSLFEIDLKNKRSPLILPVVYTDSLPDTLLLPVTLMVEEPFKSMMGEDFFEGLQAINLIKCVFYKHIDPYIAEEEWRLMLAPQETERGEERIYRPAKPSRLIAGNNMSPQDRQKLVECAELYGIPVDGRPVQ